MLCTNALYGDSYRINICVNIFVKGLRHWIAFDTLSFHMFVVQITVKIRFRRDALAGSDDVVGLWANREGIFNHLDKSYFMAILQDLPVRVKSHCMTVYVINPVQPDTWSLKKEVVKSYIKTYCIQYLHYYSSIFVRHSVLHPLYLTPLLRLLPLLRAFG